MGCDATQLTVDPGQPVGPIYKIQAVQKEHDRQTTETSVNNYYRTLRNNAEERKSRVHHGGSLESLIVTGLSFTVIEKWAVCTPDGPLL